MAREARAPDTCVLRLAQAGARPQVTPACMLGFHGSISQRNYDLYELLLYQERANICSSLGRCDMHLSACVCHLLAHLKCHWLAAGTLAPKMNASCASSNAHCMGVYRLIRSHASHTIVMMY